MTKAEDQEDLVDIPDDQLREVRLSVAKRKGASLNRHESRGTRFSTSIRRLSTKIKRQTESLLLDDEEEEETGDPWALNEALPDSGPTWSELTSKEKLKRIVISWIFKPIFMLLLLYFFICSLDLMSSAFRLLGGREAGEVLSENELLNNPICGLMLGILATVLVQSSSTSTSIVVSIVSAQLLNVKQAIFIIMGANIGTSVTNTIVSLAQVGKKNEFRRAFGGATIHDMFNWLAVLVLLPLEVVTGYLYRLTSLIVSSFNITTHEDVKIELLKKLTKPFTSMIIQIESKIIAKIAVQEDTSDSSLIKIWCKKVKLTVIRNGTTGPHQNDTLMSINQTQIGGITATPQITDVIEKGIKKCKHLFANTSMSEAAVGGILLLVSFVMLCVCLVFLVKILNSLMKGRIAFIIRRTLNADFPGPLAFLTGYVAILVGALVTFVVQSSSVFTSAMTPLVGIGVITLERMYPLTLGSNIGTTATGLLAAMASSGGSLRNALQIALCHLFFNISAILLWYPVPAMRQVPIYLAKTLGNTTAEYRWFAIMYLICMFFVLPLLVFSLSLISTWLLIGVTIPCFILLAFIVIINILQKKRPDILPAILKTWEFLPLALRSLGPMDIFISKLLTYFCRCCCPCRKGTNPTQTNENGKGIDHCNIPMGDLPVSDLPPVNQTNGDATRENEKDATFHDNTTPSCQKSDRPDPSSNASATSQLNSTAAESHNSSQTEEPSAPKVTDKGIGDVEMKIS